MIAAPPPRGLMIAAPRSGSGKTTLTIGLLRAYRRRGIRVAGAKCGPDYIDAAFHGAACGQPGVNLDSWAMKPGLIAQLAAEAAKDSDLLICEASMGLFDGVPVQPGRSGSSADVASALGLPVVLVLDVSAQSQSAGAIAKGFMTFDERVKIAGIVLNRVASERHLRLVSDGISRLAIPILGSLPKSNGMALPERHLGLVQAAETPELESKLDAMAEFVAQHVQMDALFGCAEAFLASQAGPHATALQPPGQRIAIAHDKAFSFTYRHILDGWRNSGAEIRTFSPLADEPPPADCDICWLPGGYPELHAAQIASASRFLEGLRHFAAIKPVHGECGGYMILGETLTDAAGKTYPMAGLLGVQTSFFKPKMHLGYRQARLAASGCLGPLGKTLKGHEFHYAEITAHGSDEPFAFVTDAYGSDFAPTGSRRGRVTGSFFHIIAET
ncbi:cobyrinic acid a,c-diamide synthase [Bradyrhizobium lablabi]|uniref:Hydrogenobyrinate a,c-diamide synthase n=1 Tax=Bradyrhizobium lablabi TaxID=722472 RepID=A0A0R3N043_9BRAD|nr:cobyrinate a,c-diamide synthase [Bradyrhizobium lablabi]KRR25704.1 cobyrinic acid a,c-diamide synthase [Bradyrhizobium lablabi]